MEWRQKTTIFIYLHMDKFSTVDKAIPNHGAMAVFEAGAAGTFEDFELLKVLNLHFRKNL